MTAYLVLASIGLLLAVLVQGRVAPTLLFSGWAGVYYLFGLVDEKVMLNNYTNPALAVLVVLLLVSLALERSPLLDRLSDRLLKGHTALATLRLSLVTTLFSAFLNNTAVVGALLGVIARQKHQSPSKLLLPLSYAAVLGGVTTLVGTSTNLVVSSFAVSAGLPPLGMFQFAWVGVPVALACVLVLMLTARGLPERAMNGRDGSQAWFLEAQVQSGSAMIGKSIEENQLRNLEGLFLVEILRDGRLISPVGPEEVLVDDDVLIFTGEVERVQALERFDGLHVFGHRADALLRSNLVEVVVSSESELANRTLREMDFRTMFDAGVVGIRRGEKRLTGQLGRISLRVGDSLLLAAGPDFAQHRNLDRNFHVLGGSMVRPRLTGAQSTVALGSFGAVIALAAAGVLPLLSGLLLLLAGLLLSRLLTPGEIRRRFPFDLVLIIGSALTIARVMEDSGAATLVADAMRSIFAGYGIWGAFIGVYLLTVLLTEMVTNNAAAALAFPIALTTARAFGVDPTPFVMVVAYGASACFLIPFGYQTHLMVYSPGRYRLGDFIRAGLPVSVVYGALVIMLVPVFFPFHP